MAFKETKRQRCETPQKAIKNAKKTDASKHLNKSPTKGVTACSY